MNEADRGFSLVSQAAAGAPLEWIRVRARRPRFFSGSATGPGAAATAGDAGTGARATTSDLRAFRAGFADGGTADGSAAARAEGTAFAIFACFFGFVTALTERAAAFFTIVLTLATAFFALAAGFPAGFTLPRFDTTAFAAGVFVFFIGAGLRGTGFG